MPKTGDSVGITFEGPVLNGQKSVADGFRAQQSLESVLSGQPASLTRVGDLDSAVKMHNRLPGKF
jgi:hypothetical protein